ncbi:MAG: hypothetical protein Q9219_001985 [cf. Caloplaca sp. 3 TL-2023]
MANTEITNPGPWLSSCGGSPLQLRTRLYKASVVIRTSSLLQFYQNRQPLLSPPQSQAVRPKNHLYPPQEGPLLSESNRPESPPTDLLPLPPPPPFTTLPLAPNYYSPFHAADDTTPLIDPTRANTGLSLLQNSLLTLHQNPPIARHLYIHALVYLLQAFPSPPHLSEEEKSALRSAFPTAPSHDSRSSGKEEKEEEQPSCSKPPSPPPPSVIYHTLSTLTYFFLLAIHFLGPHVRRTLSTLRAYEQEYRLRERGTASASIVVHRGWRLVKENVDPACVAWLGAEVAMGVADGWRKGMVDDGRRRDGCEARAG